MLRELIEKTHFHSEILQGTTWLAQSDQQDPEVLMCECKLQL